MLSNQIGIDAQLVDLKQQIAETTIVRNEGYNTTTLTNEKRTSKNANYSNSEAEFLGVIFTPLFCLILYASLCEIRKHNVPINIVVLL